jgi:hypothetical protein
MMVSNKKKRLSYAWIELYQARKNSQNLEKVSSSAIGRPNRALPAKKTTVYYTAGDEEAIQGWQIVFTRLLGRKPSMGETSAILARICSDRREALGLDEIPTSFPELISRLVGAEAEREERANGDHRPK